MKKILISIGVLALSSVCLSALAADESRLSENGGYKLKWENVQPLDVRLHSDGNAYVQLHNPVVGDICRFGDRWDLRLVITKDTYDMLDRLRYDMTHDVGDITIGIVKPPFLGGNCTSGDIADMPALDWEYNSSIVAVNR